MIEVEVIIEMTQELLPFIIISNENKIIKFGWKQDRYITINKPDEYHLIKLGYGSDDHIKTNRK